MIILLQQEMLARDVAADAETVILTKEELWEKNFTWKGGRRFFFKVEKHKIELEKESTEKKINTNVPD